MTLIPADIFLSCCSLAVIISIDQLVYFPPRGPISAEAGCDQRWFSTEPTSPQLAPPCPHSLITLCPSPLPCSTYPPPCSNSPPPCSTSRTPCSTSTPSLFKPPRSLFKLLPYLPVYTLIRVCPFLAPLYPLMIGFLGCGNSGFERLD